MSTKTKTTKSKAPKIDFAAKKEEARQATEGMHRRLEAGVLSDEDWARRLRFMSKLHGYSPNNSLLLWAQWEGRKEVRAAQRVIETMFFGAPVSPHLPEMTYCAGFSTWTDKMGGQVLKGEKALSVLAPFTVTDYTKDPHPVTGKYPTKVIGFVLKSRTFDMSQTEGVEAPPSAVKLLKGDGPEGLWDGLLALAESIGYNVEVTTFPGKANGDCTYVLKRIRVRATNAPAQRVKTLAHEIGHALMHDPALSPPVGMSNGIIETEAESVAYTVLNMVGFDTADYSLGYVAGWAGGDGKLIASTLERVVMTATRIVAFLETGDLPDPKGTTKYDFTKGEEAAVVA